VSFWTFSIGGHFSVRQQPVIINTDGSAMEGTHDGGSHNGVLLRCETDHLLVVGNATILWCKYMVDLKIILSLSYIA
jgi:hypothetical protein